MPEPRHISTIFDDIIKQSESDLSKAIAIAERVAPCRCEEKAEEDDIINELSNRALIAEYNRQKGE